ncbi:MAG: radical SAM protein [Roseburia sp.]
MSQNFNPNRYAVITEKNPREIVMLRGSGCVWRRCRFCDYHLDFSKDEAANFALNREQLLQITGLYHKLEVINSGSFIDLDEQTLKLIEQVCQEKSIQELHFECHWLHREAIPALRERFSKIGVAVKVKIGVETFDALFRESYLVKGIDVSDPAVISADFDEVCLLQGIPGQTVESMKSDIETGLSYFERVCVNIMTQNTMPIQPDPRVIETFRNEVYPLYEQNDRVDILMENTDFGVGGEK